MERVRRVSGGTLNVMAIAFVAVVFSNAAAAESLGFDLTSIALRASDAIVHGRHLYYAPAAWSGAPFVYVYPPLYAELVAPLLMLPEAVAQWAASLTAVLAVLAALYVVGVRDPRVFAVSTLSTPVLLGGQVANASALICLLVALSWRGSVLPLSFAIAIKLMAWPLLFWQWFTRGLRTALAGAGIAAGLIVASWALVGFDGIGIYQDVVRADIDAHRGLTIAIASSGLPGATGLAVALTVVCLVLCRRSARAGDDVSSFAWAIAAALVASPILWGYYMTLLLLPLAIRRPTLSPAWFAPLALWLGGTGLPTAWWQKTLAWSVVAVLLAACLSRDTRSVHQSADLHEEHSDEIADQPDRVARA